MKISWGSNVVIGCGPANGRSRRNRAVATHPGEGPDSAPTRPIHGGASGNAPGSGTAELTKLEIRPDLDNDEIAGCGAGAIETPTPGAVPDFVPVVGR